MPYEVVVTKSLLGVEVGTEGVEYSTRSNKHEKRGRGLPPKEREKDYDHPTHNEVDGKTY